MIRILKSECAAPMFTQDDFNANAAPPPYAELRAAIRETTANYKMLEAAQTGDWKAMRRALNEGANPTFKGNAAISLLTESLEDEAVALMQDIRSPYLSNLHLIPLAHAATVGDARVVNDMLKKTPPADTIADAAFRALRNGHDAIADTLLERLSPEEYTDRLMMALLLHRPAIFDAALGTEAYPDDLMFYLVGASIAKDEAAMNHVIDHLAEKKDMLLNRVTFDMRDSRAVSIEEKISILFSSGHGRAIERFLDTFADILPAPVSLLAIAADTGDAQGALYTRLLEKYPLREAPLHLFTQLAAENNRRPHILALEKAYPQDAKKASTAMLLSAINTGDAQTFFDTLQSGYALPEDLSQKARLFNAARAHDLNAVCRHIIDETQDKQALAVLLRLGSNSAAQLKIAAELDGDVHNQNDFLFWCAAREGHTDALSLFAHATDIKAAYPVIVARALKSAALRGDVSLIEHAVAHCDWADKNPAKSGVQKEAHRACMATPAALHAAAPLAAGLTGGALDEKDFYAMSAPHFAQVLDELAAQGFAVNTDVMTTALPVALQDASAVMMEEALRRGADLSVHQQSLAFGLNGMASQDVLRTLSKWVERAQTRDCNALQDRISAAPETAALFAGEDSLAVHAAYANEFPRILEKTGGTFDVQKLVSTVDAHGNTLLDILGAHGRLNDIMTPALWKDKDAAAFLKSHAAPCYLAQCDFATLAATLHQEKLKERKHARFTLKGRTAR